VNDRTDDVGSGSTYDPQQGPAQPHQQNQQAGPAQPHQQQQPAGTSSDAGATTQAGETSSQQQVPDGPDQDQDDIGEPPDPYAEEEADDGEPLDTLAEDKPDDASQKTSEATVPPRPDECALPKTSIQEELRKLRDETSQAIKNKVEAEGTFADRENRLKVLEGVERDFPAAKKAYDDAYAQLRRDERDIVDYLECEKKSLVALLGRAGVKHVRRRVRKFLANKRKLEKAVDSAKKAANEPSDPNAEVTKFTLELAAWKKVAATIAAQHAEIRALREDITKARQAGHYGLALFLLWKARWRRAEFVRGCGPELVDPATLHEELHGAGERLAAAQQRLAKAQRDAAASKEALAAAIKNLEEHQKTAEATLQEALKEIKGAERAQLGAQ
jgi:hypothetical protein